MKNNGKSLGLFSGLFWGLDSVLIGLILSSVVLVTLGDKASLVTTFLHDTASFITLFILLIVRKQNKDFFKVLFSKSGLAIIAAALLGGPIGMSAYILSIQYIGASLASSISAVYPIIGIIFAWLFLKEKIKLHNIIGIMISVAAIILMGISSLGTINNALIGVVLVLVCAIGWGSEAVIIKAALKEDVSSEVALAIRQMTTMLTYGLFIMPVVGYSNVISLLNETSIMMLIVVTAVVGTISYLFYYKAIDVLGVAPAMALNITYPAWAFLFQFLIDRQFNLYHFFLSVIIIIGSMLSNEDVKDIFKVVKRAK